MLASGRIGESHEQSPARWGDRSPIRSINCVHDRVTIPFSQRRRLECGPAETPWLGLPVLTRLELVSRLVWDRPWHQEQPLALRQLRGFYRTVNHLRQERQPVRPLVLRQPLEFCPMAIHLQRVPE